MENMTQPELVMIIEPEDKFRFRYDSEKNSHGGVIGKVKTSDGKKTHPTVQLVNYYGKNKVYIRVSLYTLNNEKHVLEIKGKKAENGVYCQDLDKDFTATFTGLAIMSKKKEEIIKILMDRKINSIGRIRGAARTQLEKAHEPEIKEKAKEIMNSAKLCFEALTKDKPTIPICPPLFSGPIYNQKCSERGTLKIHHLSHYSGSWKGEETVILLCDKVQKGKVKVQFYETDNEDDEICKWKQDAKFTDADVHYQYAIKFRTPTFRDNIEKEVKVCLVRDEERSNSVSFLFKSDENVNPSKKRKLLSDLESRNFSAAQCTYSENTPSPSSSSNDYSSDNLMEQVPACDMSQIYNLNINDTQMNTGDTESFYPASSVESTINSNFQDSNCMDYQSGVDITALLKLYDVEFKEDLLNERDNPENSIATSFPILMDEYMSGYAPDGPAKVVNQRLELSDLNLSDDYNNEPKNSSWMPQSAVLSLQNNLDKSAVAPGKVEFQMSLEKCMSNLTLEGKGETVSVTSPVLKSMKPNRMSNNFKDKLKEICSKCMSMRDELDNSLLHVAVFENKDKDVKNILEMSKIASCDIVNVKNCNNKTALHIAAEKNHCRTLSLLIKYGGNSNLKDENGNNCLHIAAANECVNCVKEIFSHRCCPDVNAFNYQGLTPLHISVMKGSFACVELFVKFADVNERDKTSGRSPLHFAVDMHPFLLPILLGKHNIYVNIQDFGGNTPLHLASISANVDCVRQLLEAGADPLIRNFNQDSDISNENYENENFVGKTAVDLAENIEIKNLMLKATEETPDSVHSECVLDPVTEEKLCQLLDPEKYQNLAECIGMDKGLIGQLIKLNPSPTKQILQYLKRQYEDQYLDILKNSLEIAGLDEALNIIKEKPY